MSKRKPITAAKLIKQLQDICDDANVDPKDVIIYYRRTRNSDVDLITYAEEDLYDSDTNKILETIVLFTDPREI